MRQDEYRIRLRAAWDFQAEPDVPGDRVDLPTTWPPKTPRQFRLVRRFGHPRVDSTREQVELELRDVPGVVAAIVDGIRHVRPTRDAGPWLIPLASDGQHRHTVVLEVELDADPGGPWGTIAVVVSARED